MKFYVRCNRRNCLIEPCIRLSNKRYKLFSAIKLTTIILTFFCLPAVAAPPPTITLNFDNAPMAKVLKEIEKQSGYQVFYSNEVLAKAKPVTVHMTNTPLERGLQICFNDQPLSYEIVRETILIKLKAVSNKPAIPQSGSSNINGRVIDSLGKPILGASVKLSPGNYGTLTNNLGIFSFRNITPGTYSLSVSFIGFQPLVMSVDANEEAKLTTLTLTLKEEASALSEVVVNTGYQRIKPTQVTGATASIGTKEYESQINTDFVSGLENKLPGLVINKNIQFNGNSLFEIRGLSTISGNQTPLIVVDGLPTDLSLSDINPNEIKSVTVLKDAAAAAIYGVRASNGVIIIERKQAVAGNTRYAFRATTGITPKENYSRYRWAPEGTTDNFIRALYQDGANPSVVNPATYQAYVNAGYRWPIINYDILAERAGGMITQAQENQQFSSLESYNNANDYNRLFAQTAVTQQYNMDVSGGNDRNQYYFTADYLGNKLNQVKNSNQQIQISGRTTFNFTKKFSLEFTTDYTDLTSNAAPVPSISSFYPWEHFQNADGSPAYTFNGTLTNPIWNTGQISKGFLDNNYYPLVDINQVNTYNHNVDTRFTGRFKYLLGAGFNLHMDGIYERSDQQQNYYASGQSSVAHEMINKYIDATTTPFTFDLPNGGYLQQTANILKSYTVRAQLDYNKQLGADHSINAIIGTEIRSEITQSSTAPYFGYNPQTLLSQPVDFNKLTNAPPAGTYYATINPGINYTSMFQQLYNEDRFVSGYFNAVYAYKNRYSLTGSLRIDQSNLFGTDPRYRYQPLWSVGFAWNIDQENFMKNVDWVKSLKLRIADGFDGNVSKASLPQVIATSVLNYVTATSTPALSLLTPANSGLRWEQTNNFNIGLDYRLFTNITGSFDIYNKRSTDLMATSQIDATRGVSSALVNQASVNNRGAEVNLHADWIHRKEFNWNSGFVLSYNTSKVLDIYNNAATTQVGSQLVLANAATGYLKGYPIDEIFSYRYAGLDNMGAPMIYDKAGNKIHLGAANDQASDLVDEGSGIPKYSVGFSNRVDIGRFYIYAMLNYYGGFVARVPYPTPNTIRPIEGAQYFWTKAGDESNPDEVASTSKITTAGAYSGPTVYNYLDKYTVNGSYVTLSDITASYNFGTFPALTKLGFSNFEVRLQGSNLYTKGFNRYDWSQATGSFAKSYVTPTYTIGLYTNF